MIVLIGPIAPPVHGASVITRRVAESLAAERLNPVVVNTLPNRSARGFGYHLARLSAYVYCCVVLVGGLRSPRKVAYFSLSGGLGRIYELGLVTLARLCRYDIIFHHHSFAYFNRPSRVMRAIIRIAGSRQMHITLCAGMARRLSDLYRPDLHTRIVPNLVFLDMPDSAVRGSNRPPTVVGYLSNISFAKGIDRYLDLLAALRAKGSPVAGRIAGPFADREVERYVERRMREIGGVEYIGAVYDDRKEAFLASIDLLVFPTRYQNEAQPLVVYEAQAAGVPVAASDRGCIRQMLGGTGPLLLDFEAADLSSLVSYILSWEADPSSYWRELKNVSDQFAASVKQRASQSASFRDLFLKYR